MQFYTNNFAVPEKGARKKIHGGSGAIGDGYTPGCASSLFSFFLSLERPDADFDTGEQPRRSSSSTRRSRRGSTRSRAGLWATTRSSRRARCTTTLCDSMCGTRGIVVPKLCVEHLDDSQC